MFIMAKRSLNIVLFPFMAQGHIIPYLALAQHILQNLKSRTRTITFVNTPLNIKNLQKSLHPNLLSSIRLVQIPFNSSDHGLPPDSENTDQLPYNLIIHLFKASQSLKHPFKNLLSDILFRERDNKQVSVLLIYDFLFGWAAEVARELGVYHAVFSTTGGFGMACYASIWLNLPHKDSEGFEFELPDFPEAGVFHVTQLAQSVANAAYDDPFTAFLQYNIREWSKADAMLFNTVEEIDRTGLNYFRRKLGIPVYGIGPLLLSEEDRSRIGRQSTIDPKQCVDWLHKKEPNSVIYISFGSQNTITPSQMMNLAKALESTDRNFIWVVRPPLGFDINEEFVAEEWLPDGFADRVRSRDKGLIVDKWAPQVEILRHGSTAAFLSHCGWNSVLESLQNGVPIIGWPMAAEQFNNAKWLVEEVGVCVEVARGTSFEVREKDVADKIELVLGENEKGREISKRCLEIKEILMDAVRDESGYKGSSVRAMEEFFNNAAAASALSLER